MTEPGRDARCVRYYCTAGNGMERFLMEEVKKKLGAEDVRQLPGKVLFSSSMRIDQVTELRSAERLFLLLKHDSPLSARNTSPAKASSLLQSSLLADKSQWTNAAMTWSRLQGELAEVKRKTTTSSTDVSWREMRKREEVERRGGEEEQMEEEGRGGGAEEEDDAKEGERKRRREAGQGEDTVRRVEKKVKTDNEEETAEDDKEQQRTDMAKECRVDNGGHEIPTGGKDNPEHQTINNRTGIPFSFRISCKCTGALSRSLSSQEVSRVMGVGLSRLLDWKVDLKNPQLEVNIHLTDDLCLLGIPLTRLPLAHRSYIKTTGLRSTVAWAMTSLAQIQPGFCVVDPMCGVGTILIEAAQENRASCFLGVDIDDGQLQRANENVEFAELGSRVHLMKGSALALPLPGASMDAVICDLPFGRKFGTKTNMAANLPVIVTEMERVLRVGGTLVLLLSPQLSCVLKKALAQQNTSPVSHQEMVLQPGIQDSSSPPPPPPTEQQQNLQNHHGLQFSPPHRDSETEQQLRPLPPPPLCSLRHQTTVRVSLGAIDGLIHKYVKTDQSVI